MFAAVCHDGCSVLLAAKPGCAGCPAPLLNLRQCWDSGVSASNSGACFWHWSEMQHVQVQTISLQMGTLHMTRCRLQRFDAGSLWHASFTEWEAL